MHRVHRGVYLVGHTAAAPGAVQVAALLTCGDDSVLSHRTAAMRKLLDRAEGPALTRSEAEVRLLDLLHAGKLPPPETNARLGAYEVDMLWRDQRLVVEVDGYAFHSTRAAFERDRTRDAHLQSLGLRVIRTTWRQIDQEPQALLVRIAQLLAVQPPAPQPSPPK